MGLGKQFSLTERTQLQFRAEFFNIFNHPQYGQPQLDFAAGPGAFGSILSPLNMSPVGTGTPRQVQFALRLVF